MEQKHYFFADEMALVAHAMATWRLVKSDHGLVFLSGPLGAGKSTWVRAFLKAAGVQDRVVSPSYTLVEQYQVASKCFVHCDFYRLTGAASCLELGLDEYWGKSIVLIEWPEIAVDALPKPDLWCRFDFGESGHTLKAERLGPLTQALV